MMVEHRAEAHAIGRVVAQQVAARRRIAAQCPAERDVDFLKAPANTEQGLPCRDHRVDKLGHHAVAIGIKGALEIGRAHVELQSLLRNSYAVFCLKKKKIYTKSQ